MNRLATFLIPVVALSISLSGCGGSKTKGPQTVPVKGTLKVGGAPAADVQITLSPIDEGLQAASGNTGPNGEFALTTGQTGTPGAMVGKYKVVLRSLAGTDADYMNQTEDNSEEAADGGSATPSGGGKIPKKYENQKTSDKEVEITGKTNDLVIEIE